MLAATPVTAARRRRAGSGGSRQPVAIAGADPPHVRGGPVEAGMDQRWGLDGSVDLGEGPEDEAAPEEQERGGDDLDQQHDGHPPAPA